MGWVEWFYNTQEEETAAEVPTPWYSLGENYWWGLGENAWYIMARKLTAVRTVPLIKRSKKVCQAEVAQQTALFENAKQLGVAILLYAQDHGEVLPTGDDIRSKLSRYVKNHDLFNGFVYTYRGGKTDEISSPLDTHLGYVQGAGGRSSMPTGTWRGAPLRWACRLQNPGSEPSPMLLTIRTRVAWIEPSRLPWIAT